MVDNRKGAVSSTLSKAFRLSLMVAVLAVTACAPQVVQQPAPMLTKKATVTTPAPVAEAPVYTPSPAAPVDPAYTSPGPGWIEAGETDDFVRFLHQPTVRTVGPGRVQAWTMQNHTRTSSRSGSARTQYEFDCRGRTYAILADATYTRPNASGQTILNFEIPRARREVRAVPSGTVGEVGFLLACGA